MSNTTTDPRFECLVAFMRGETVRVGGFRFQPISGGRVAVFTAGRFVLRTTHGWMWFIQGEHQDGYYSTITAGARF